MIKELIQSLRPRQWYKNLLVFIGLFFTGELFNLSSLILIILAFILFCLISGSIYIINDILDFETDKLHSVKCNRPIASERLKIRHGLVFAIGLAIAIILVSYVLINVIYGLLILFYFILMTCYSLFLKHIFLVDSIAIATNFAIRVAAGYVAISANISFWFVMCAFLLAIILVLGKRKHEINLLKSTAKEHRKSLETYFPDFIDQLVNISTSGLIISYLLFCYFSGFQLMVLTIPVMLCTVFRYLFLSHSENIDKSDDVTYEFIPYIKDKGMKMGIISWTLLCVTIIYV
jgi:4-hydroxybenzoate polyprenyltransferase